MCHASEARAVVYVFTAVFGFVVVQAEASPPLVSDQTAAVGLDTPHAQVFTGADMEFMAAGGAAGDFDNDGDQDLFILGGSASVDHLYINDGTGHFVDQGAQAGIDRSHQGTGVAVGDYDGDGDLDIFVTSLGPPQIRKPNSNIMWQNQGDGTFIDVTEITQVGENNPIVSDAYSASFGDYDLDGDLDLAVAGWLGGSRLYQNNGNGTFKDVTSSALGSDMFDIRGFTPKFVDMDGDRYPELLWVADFYTSQYFINNTDGTFTNGTLNAGTGLDSNGMGNTFGDYNNDGAFDWYVASRITHDQLNGSGNMLYQGTSKDHVFDEVSIASGCNYGFWGWGVISVDMNQDGALDLFATNGFDGDFAGDPSILYLNDGTGNFVDVTAFCGMNDAGQGRGVINADFDLDGDQDVIVLNNSQPMVYYRNEIEQADGDANSITLEFNTLGVGGLAPNGFGTRVLIDSNTHSQIRYLDGGSNYLSQSELSVHAGIGSDGSAMITVLWANGETDVFPDVLPGRYTINALACTADLAPDGVLNFFDVSAFLNMFTQHHPQGDVNHDGLYNFFDVSAFLAAFASGCP